MSNAAVEKYNEEPMVLPLSHRDRYGPAMAKVGYNSEAAQKEATQNLKEGAKTSPFAKLNELLRSGDNTKEAKEGNKRQVDVIRKALDKLSSKNTQKKVKN